MSVKILDSVRKRYPGKTEVELEVLTFELTDRDELLRIKFEHLLADAEEVVDEVTQDNALMSGFHSLEEQMAHQRAKQGVVKICHLPVKLRLSKLQPNAFQGVSQRFASLLRYEYGPLHAALQVGDMVVEWGQESLVVPVYDPTPAPFTAHVHNQGEWFDKTSQLVKDMSLADRMKDRNRKIEILYNSFQKKEDLLKKLVDVIVDYNLNKKYGVYGCNCQHFVLDALAALGIRDPPQFTGRLNEYLQRLKQGKTHYPDEFQSHEALDEYVKNNLAHLSAHDTEYLLCQYFQFHFPSMEAAEENDVEWKCKLVPRCQSGVLEKKIGDQTLLLNQFLRKGGVPRVERQRSGQGPVSRHPAVSPVQEEENEEGDEEIQVVNGGGVGEQEEVVVVNDDARVAIEEAGDTDQAQLLARYSGYGNRIAAKVRAKFPEKSEKDRSDIADVLTSPEKFRNKYFARVVEGTTAELATSASTDHEHFINSQLSQGEARRNSIDRFQAATNLSVKFLLRTRPGIREQGHVTDSPLQGYLQIENHVLNWDESSLVEPTEEHTLTNSQPIYKCNIDLSTWFAFVKKQEPRRQKAIDERNHGLEVDLIYELTQRRDALISSLIDVIIDYNRNKQYDERSCNNQHFIRDMCRAIGNKQPPEICASFNQQLRKIKPSRRIQHYFPTHNDLDMYVRGQIQNGSIASFKSYDMDFLIGQYFMFHITSWDNSRQPLQQWKCEMDTCMLDELEKQSPIFEQGWCVLL